MRALKRAISLFLAGITALTMMCVGTINAGAYLTVDGNTVKTKHTISDVDCSDIFMFAIEFICDKKNFVIFSTNFSNGNTIIWETKEAAGPDTGDDVLGWLDYQIVNVKSSSSSVGPDWSTGYPIVFSAEYTIEDAEYAKLIQTASEVRVFYYSISKNTWRYLRSPVTGLNENTQSSDSKDISTLSVSSISNQTYSGKAKTPDVKIKDGSYTLKKGTDYTLSYKDNKKIGKATVTITGKGKYSGTKTVTFKIIPKKTTLTVKKIDEKYTFSWGKVSGVDKYQIYYSTDGKNYTKLANISGKKTSYSTAKLDESKTYSFKIRSYKKVDGKTYYSKFSKVVKK